MEKKERVEGEGKQTGKREVQAEDDGGGEASCLYNKYVESSLGVSSGV